MVRLFLALLLVAAQAAILGLALFAPRVSATHRAYYLDHTTQCWLRDGQGDIPATDTIRPASLDPDTFCRLLPVGWALEEPFGRASHGAWSSRAATEIRLPLRPGDRSVRLTLRGYAPDTPAPGAQPVTISMPGAAPIAAQMPHRGEATLCVPVPPGVREALPIAIAIAHPGRPSLAGDAHDPRATGLELVEIRRGRDTDCGGG